LAATLYVSKAAIEPISRAQQHREDINLVFNGLFAITANFPISRA